MMVKKITVAAMALIASVGILGCQQHARSGHGTYELLVASSDVFKPDSGHVRVEEVVRYNTITGETWLSDNSGSLAKVPETATSPSLPPADYKVTLNFTESGHILLNRIDRNSGAAWYMDANSSWQRYTSPG